VTYPSFQFRLAFISESMKRRLSLPSSEGGAAERKQEEHPRRSKRQARTIDSKQGSGGGAKAVDALRFHTESEPEKWAREENAPDDEEEDIASEEEFYRETSIDALAALVARAQSIVLLTGAGVSLASGIPTYRGSEGFWTIGSKNYTPQAIATNRMYRSHPHECWKYFVERHFQCKSAEPNEAHRAIARLEKLVETRGGDFTLVSQNVDGLHLRAGSRKPLEIHGNLSYVRCLDDNCEGSRELSPFPYSNPRGDDDEGKHGVCDPKLVICSRCKRHPVRPSVLFFDENYDEEIYRAGSATEALEKADLLIMAGTQACTQLPSIMIAIAAQNGIDVVDINPNLNGALYENFYHRPLLWVNDKAEVAFPRLNRALLEQLERGGSSGGGGGGGDSDGSSSRSQKNAPPCGVNDRSQAARDRGWISAAQAQQSPTS